MRGQLCLPAPAVAPADSPVPAPSVAPADSSVPAQAGAPADSPVPGGDSMSPESQAARFFEALTGRKKLADDGEDKLADDGEDKEADDAKDELRKKPAARGLKRPAAAPGHVQLSVDGPHLHQLVLGCSRCRWGPKGCKTCQSPSFNGKRGQKA
jgi:hypothetical protein